MLKSHIYLLFLLAFTACQFNNQNDLESMYNVYPFDLDVEKMKQDRMNKYGAGDCWGNIQSLSSKGYSIVIDSTDCGDYGFNLKFYLLQEGSMKISHHLQGSFMIVDDHCVLTETVYDCRKSPYLKFQRIDTSKYSITDIQINKDFVKTELKNSQDTYNNLVLGMNGPWSMIEDN